MITIKRKNAFTLSEATLTLFILSVIAAVMIPAAVNVSPDQFKPALRNAYSMTSGTISNLINNDDLYPSGEMIVPLFDANGNKNTNPILIPKGFLYEDTGTKHTYNSSNSITTYQETNDIAWEYEALVRNCKCNNSKTKKLVRAFCCSMNVSAANCPDTGTACTFTTNNGMVWTVTQNSNIKTANRDSTPMLYVEVDLNGTGKPNSKTATSPDQYKFNVFYNGRIETTQASSDAYYQSSLKAKEYLESPTKNKKKQ